VTQLQAKLIDLIQRYTELGDRLPPDDELDVVLADPRRCAEVRVLLDQMRTLQAQINAFMTVHGTEGRR
jgi:Tfp pilus assembly protein PilO